MITLHESEKLRARIIGAQDPVPLEERPRPWLQPPLTWTYDGQAVWAPVGPTMWASGRVTSACGVQARVFTSRWERWFHVSDLRGRS